MAVRKQSVLGFIPEPDERTLDDKALGRILRKLSDADLARLVDLHLVERREAKLVARRLLAAIRTRYGRLKRGPKTDPRLRLVVQEIYVAVYHELMIGTDPETIARGLERVLERAVRIDLPLKFSGRWSAHSRTRGLVKAFLEADNNRVTDRYISDLVPVKKFPEIRREVRAISGS